MTTALGSPANSATAEPLPPDGPHGRIGVLVCGHGSRNRLAVGEFASLAEALRRDLAPIPLEYGYLEFARPILRDGLDALRRQGVDHVLAVPAMLFAAGHAKNDIPSVLNTYAAESGLRIDYGRELGVDRRMILAAGGRIRDGLAAAATADRAAGREPIAVHDTLLVVVGRGSSDPDANSNVAKVTRMLVEGFGFGWGETLYSGVTFPLVEPGLRAVVKLGFRRIVVFPYFLFSGVLVSRIRQHSQRVADDHPSISFVQAGYLGEHPQVLGTFRERVEEVLRGDTDMNCSLCKYRAQVLGFEREVGMPQHSHHHHVEGLVESCQLCERECTGACQEAAASTSPEAQAAAHPNHNHSHSHSHSLEEGPGHSHSHSHSHGHGHGHSHGHDHHQGHSYSPAEGHSHSQGSSQGPGPNGSPSASQSDSSGQRHNPAAPGAGDPPGDSGERAAAGADQGGIDPAARRHGPGAVAVAMEPPAPAGPEASPALQGNSEPPPEAAAVHQHQHHHPPYPHADHPFGPRSLRQG